MTGAGESCGVPAVFRKRKFFYDGADMATHEFGQTISKGKSKLSRWGVLMVDSEFL